MNVGERDREVYEEILRWEERFFIVGEATKHSVEGKEQTFQSLDTIIFFIQALAQSPNWQRKSLEKVLQEARIFDESIDSIDDISRLPIHQILYLAEQQVTKQSYPTLLRGGLTGLGGFLLLSLDIPLMIAHHMRTIQLIALAHGYTITNPTEMLISLKVLHTATVPKSEQYQAWKTAEQEVEKLTHPYLYETDDLIVDRNWLEGQFKHVIKAMSIRLLRKNTVAGIPIISIAIGAGVNYVSFRNVAVIAQKFYTKRLLNERNR